MVLSNLGFSLARGETLLVSGRNGAGKSTLLRTLAGLLQPLSGAVRFGLANEDVRGVETVHYLGYEDGLKPSLTVGENLEFWSAMLAAPSSPAAKQRGRGTMRSMVEGAAIAPAIDNEAPPPPPPLPVVPLPRFAGEDMSPREALAAYGIARLLDLPAAYLSAGQKRRVALARLLLAPRPIWLLDEPLIALDLSAQQRVVDIMAAHTIAGGAILVASHQPLALTTRQIELDGHDHRSERA